MFYRAHSTVRIMDMVTLIRGDVSKILTCTLKMLNLVLMIMMHKAILFLFVLGCNGLTLEFALVLVFNSQFFPCVLNSVNVLVLSNLNQS